MSLSEGIRARILMVAMVSAAPIVACTPTGVSPVTTRPECPTHDSLLAPATRQEKGAPTFAPVAQFAIPGVTSKVPEFHDCQRLVETSGRFGPMVAVFASRFLDSVWYGVDSGIVKPPRQSDWYPPVGTVGLVLSYDGAYAPLGIDLFFNCLYVYDKPSAPGGVGARMVPVGTNEAACDSPFDPGMAGTELSVRRVRPPGNFGYDDYPPVARWDFDPRSGNHFIGIKCGPAWCEVGGQGFGPSSDHDTPDPDQNEKRVFRIKGWYDEQRVAIQSAGGLQPGGSIGTIVPANNLERLTVQDFQQWRLAARVSFNPHSPPYETKFGYTASSIPASMNRVFLCQGPWTDCRQPTDPAAPPTCSKPMGVEWWAKILTPAGTARYKCVYRHDHSGLAIRVPGTARWRWILSDETKWMRCDDGCCQVDGEM